MTVKIYTTPTCRFCKLEKAFFDQAKITYTEIDCSDQQNARELLSISHQLSVPFTVVTDDQQNETLILGFDPEKLKTTLKI